MSTLSQDIQNTISNVMTIYADISTLLQDADAYMEKAGYECLHGNEIMTEASRSIVNPASWIYPYFARYYGNAERIHEVKGIGIIFLDRQLQVIQPIFLSGTFIMRPDRIDQRRYRTNLRDAWYLGSHDRSLGSIYYVKEIQYVEYGEIQGIPLVAVGDIRDLERHIVEPLISRFL